VDTTNVKPMQLASPMQLPPGVKYTPLRGDLKSYEVQEVQNGYIILSPGMYTARQGDMRHFYIAKDMVEVAVVLRRLQAGREVE